MNTSTANAPERLEYIERPELVIGLVGAVGLGWDRVVSILEEELKCVDYRVVPIHISRLFEEIFGQVDERTEPYDDRLRRLMDQGDALRETLNHRDAAALLSVAAIQRAREDENRERSR